MGRYFALGLPVQISIGAGRRCFDFESIKPKVKKCIEKYIDASYYRIDDDDAHIFYTIKDADLINSELTELLNEVKSICNLNHYFMYNYGGLTRDEIRNFKSSTEIKDEDYNLKLHFFDENYKYASESEKEEFEGEFGIIKKDEIEELDTPYYVTNTWMSYRDEGIKVGEVKIIISYILIDFDRSKVVLEDETFILWTLNNIARKYFKGKLAKNLQFYITD